MRNKIRSRCLFHKWESPNPEAFCPECEKLARKECNELASNTEGHFTRQDIDAIYEHYKPGLRG